MSDLPPRPAVPGERATLSPMPTPDRPSAPNRPNPLISPVLATRPQAELAGTVVTHAGRFHLVVSVTYRSRGVFIHALEPID